MSDSQVIRTKIQKELASLRAQVDLAENRLASMRARMDELTRLLAACNESDQAAAALRQLAQVAGVRSPIRDFNKSDRPLSPEERDEQQYGIQSWTR
jgi:predicted  nucleic acid-binding Zn-ribbon protein